MARYRSPAAWRRRLVKKMKRRALTFQDRAETPEEAKAWGKVASWCSDILGYSELRENDDLGLRQLTDHELDQIIFERNDPIRDGNTDEP